MAPSQQCLGRCGNRFRCTKNTRDESGFCSLHRHQQGEELKYRPEDQRRTKKEKDDGDVDKESVVKGKKFYTNPEIEEFVDHFKKKKITAKEKKELGKEKSELSNKIDALYDVIDGCTAMSGRSGIVFDDESQAIIGGIQEKLERLLVLNNESINNMRSRISAISQELSQPSSKLHSQILKRYGEGKIGLKEVKRNDGTTVMAEAVGAKATPEKKSKGAAKGKKPEEKVEKIECPICLEEKKYCVLTMCGHQFCGKCLAKHVEKKNDCPVCKQKIISGLRYDRGSRFVDYDSGSYYQEYYSAVNAWRG